MASGSAKKGRYQFRAPDQRLLFRGQDHGPAMVIPPAPFAPDQRGGGWGPFAESFVKFNRAAFEALDLEVDLSASAGGVSVGLVPGGKAGAIPLRSAQTGRVSAGLVISPRFGWGGVGQVLADTGWHAMPTFIEGPLVPGSGREVPAWVLAGPVLARLELLIRHLRRGYQEKEETQSSPRGRILWDRYAKESLASGRWHQLPCRYWDLGTDPLLRQHLRWVLRRIREDLVRVGSRDPIAALLVSQAIHLDRQLGNVEPVAPRPHSLRQYLVGSGIANADVRRGIEAMAWVVEERGLGGGREQDGLAWALPLDRLWEGYVEAVVRREAAQTGGDVSVGRAGQTTIPLLWSDPIHRSLGHLTPDIVVRQGRRVKVVDAKYKAHLAELDESGWRRFAEETREAHRADLHQILAYAALFDADEITATLVYPLRRETYSALKSQGRDVSSADIVLGGRYVRLELRGMPFGAIRTFED